MNRRNFHNRPMGPSGTRLCAAACRRLNEALRHHTFLYIQRWPESIGSLLSVSLSRLINLIEFVPVRCRAGIMSRPLIAQTWLAF